MTAFSDTAQAIAEWQELARAVAGEIALDNDCIVSANDLYDAIMTAEGPYAQFPAPPLGNYKRGHALCHLFKSSPMFEHTGEEVPGTNPRSRGRKVGVWKYLPEKDRSGIDPAKTRTWD